MTEQGNWIDSDVSDGLMLGLCLSVTATLCAVESGHALRYGVGRLPATATRNPSPSTKNNFRGNRTPLALEPQLEAPATETLADALDLAYRTTPALQADRYALRASDEDYALALSELRPTTKVQLTGSYDRTVPGRITQALRSPADQLSSPDITDNNGRAELVVSQPLLTGGRAAADRDVALNAVTAGRSHLRQTEGDLFLQVITAYSDIRRDTQALALRDANLRQLEGTLSEVVARREAGELTRTDIAQAETQFDLARAQYNSEVEQFQQDRGTYAALVGHDPGTLAPAPELPGFPKSVDEALTIAGQRNPELAEAIATERSSRGRIAAAGADGRPSLSLRGSMFVTDRLFPLHDYNADHGVTGQAVLTIPLTNGGRVGALVAQAKDRNAADQLGIEATRRHVVQSLVAAWNAVATAQRNIVVEEAQVASAKTFDEGTFEEYRAGLRSTFDVLFAHSSLRDSEIALSASRRDLYVAQASLLRQMGTLEAKTLLTGARLYDPSVNFRHAARRAALPWDGAVRALDSVDRGRSKRVKIQSPAPPSMAPKVPSAAPAATVPIVDRSAVRSDGNPSVGAKEGNRTRE